MQSQLRILQREQHINETPQILVLRAWNLWVDLLMLNKNQHAGNLYYKCALITILIVILFEKLLKQLKNKPLNAIGLEWKSRIVSLWSEFHLHSLPNKVIYSVYTCFGFTLTPESDEMKI